MLSSDDEWKVVTKNDKKRVTRKRGPRLRLFQPASHPIVLGSEITDYHLLQETLASCVTALQQTNFYDTLINQLDEILQRQPQLQPFSQIVCYGIGHFSHTTADRFSASLWQLAGLVALRDYLEQTAGQPIKTLYFDPSSSPFENDFLSQQKPQIHVLTENERGRRHLHGTPTLFFMPHCPRKLYENVLVTNWEEFPTTLLVIIGNSLINYANALSSPNGVQSRRELSSTSSSSLSTSSVSPSCLQLLLPFLKETKVNPSTMDCKNAPGYFVTAFNDTYVTRVHAEEEDDDSQSLWPQRPCEKEQNGDEDDPELW